MNNLPTQNQSSSYILSMKHWTKEQWDLHNNKYTASTTEPMIFTGGNNKNRLNEAIAAALFTPGITPKLHSNREVTLVSEDMGNFSPVQDCKHPPSQLMLALVHRLK